MFEEEAIPTPYYNKPQMKFKNYDIFYNLDYNLSEIKPNQHNYYELYFLLSGSVKYYVEEHKYSVGSGDIILISPNQRHQAYINNKDSIPYERYVLWLNPNYIESLSSSRTNLSFVFQFFHITNQKIKLPKDVLSNINYLFKSIFINSKSERYGSELLANAYITELLVYLSQICLFSSNSIVSYRPAGILSKEFTLVLKILTYIENNIYESINIDDICNHCFVSRSYLSKIFTTELGLPIYKYIIKKKLFLSRQDIMDGLLLQEVCDKYSFGNYSSFYRNFTKEFGQSPQSFKLENS